MAMDSEIPIARTETSGTTTHTLALIWSEVLQSSGLPNPNDDFFELGGNSMAMVQVEARIKEEFAVELPAGTMLNASTLGALARLIESRELNPTAHET